MNVRDAPIRPESKLASSAVTVWARALSFVQRTASPVTMSTRSGLTEENAMLTLRAGGAWSSAWCCAAADVASRPVARVATSA